MNIISVFFSLQKTLCILILEIIRVEVSISDFIKRIKSNISLCVCVSHISGGFRDKTHSLFMGG